MLDLLFKSIDARIQSKDKQTSDSKNAKTVPETAVESNNKKGLLSSLTRRIRGVFNSQAPLSSSSSSSVAMTPESSLVSVIEESSSSDAEPPLNAFGNFEAIPGLHPTKIANVESLLASARPGERIIKTWSTVSPSSLALLQKNALRHGDHYRFLIAFKVRLLRSWLDGWRINAGISSNEELRMIQGVPVVLTTEVLLHQTATPADIFQALVIVNRAIYEFDQASDSTDIDRAAAKLQNMPSDDDLRWRETEEETLKRLKLDEDFADQLSESAYAYEFRHREEIYYRLQLAGWDMKRLTYGSIKARVQW